MLPFRVIVANENRTTNFVVTLDHAPYAGETFTLPLWGRVHVLHVISAYRDGLAGIVMAEAA